MHTTRFLRAPLLATAALACLALAAPPAFAQRPPAINSDSVAEARLKVRKLELEVEELERKSNRVERIVTLLTPLVAVLGFWFTVFQFMKSQQKDRQDRLEARKRRDEERLVEAVDQLLSIEPEKQPAIGKIAFLLAELRDLVGRNPDAEQRITTALVQFVQNDADFAKARFVQVDLAAMESWPAYVRALEEDQQLNIFLTYRYVQALRGVHDERPEYFEKIQWDGTGYRVENLTEEERYLRFEALMRGFVEHLRMVADEQRRNRFVAEFQDALRNLDLTAALSSRLRAAGLGR